MKKRFPLIIAIVVMILTVFSVALPVSAQIADGTYQVNYEMKHSDNGNTSIADGYFTKPATLIVKNGVQTIQLTVTGSNYIKSLSSPSGPVDVISEDEGNQTRTVQFSVNGDLSQPINMKMHIVVPDMYDTTHTARMVIDTSNLPEGTAGSTGSTGEKAAADDGAGTDGNAEQAAENPRTGDDTSVALYVFLMLASVIAVVAIWKMRPVRN